MQVGGGPVDIVAMYALALIVNLCGFLWAAGIATRLRTIQAGPLMQMPVFLLLFLAPVYVPLALLGDTLHAIARFNPLTYALEAGRGFLAGDPVHVGLGFGAPILVAALLTIWALRGLRSAEAAG
jgi:ABC-2 type transport system permease protein